MSESRMKQNGFTLIELIVTIIILGILAVVIAPRFSSSESYQEHSYRAQAISLIRAVQLRAMQQTDNSFNCHAVNIASDEISSDDTAPCNVNVLSVPIENGDDVTFELDGGTGSIGFDTFGGKGYLHVGHTNHGWIGFSSDFEKCLKWCNVSNLNLNSKRFHLISHRT